jgi:hypothetical protein
MVLIDNTGTLLDISMQAFDILHEYVGRIEGHKAVDLQGTDKVAFFCLRVAEVSWPGIFCCGASNFEGVTYSGFCRDSLELCGICPAASRSLI